ncbi:MAG: VIT1/CCC1 transporter family protein [Thermoproteota archaeon]|nr:VIT1/CCC1 transporter family protein [Candidatus Brockarchaeota archaeon]
MINSRKIDEETRKVIIEFQQNEITEYILYKKLSNKVDGKNKETLREISEEELKHYNLFKKYTNVDTAPKKLKVVWYSFISRVFGLTFAIKSMENGEKKAQENYLRILNNLPEIKEVVEDEEKHENALISLINEEWLNYMSSVVLGLNDALVELTGTIAGLTFTLQNSSIIGLASLITGIAASLSMASSEYLSKKAESDKNNPSRAALYTGIAYILTVIVLVYPYFMFKEYYVAFITTILNAVFVILVFTYFSSTVKEQNFKKKFIEMVSISFGVAVASFLIGDFVKSFLNLNL